MIKIFKTDVSNFQLAGYLLDCLSIQYPNYKMNFDLEDCDNILRIEGTELCSESIIKQVLEITYCCEELH